MKLSGTLWTSRAGARALATLMLAGAALLLVPSAFADGEPKPWEIGMQPGVTPVRQHMDSLFSWLVVVTTLIAVFVGVLLIYVCWRYSAKRHPMPSTATHNPLLEVTWTVLPVLILVAIAIPSMRLIFFMGDANAQHPTMSLDVTAHQWYWTYGYPDQGNFSFDSNIIPADKLKPGQPRLLSVDNRAVVPVDTVIRILVRSTDVIHSFYVPSFGVQEYAMPGHVNHAWIKVEKTGIYRGECNQLCGINHAFMPIVFQVVSKADFAKWVQQAKKRFADGNGTAGPVLASAAK